MDAAKRNARLLRNYLEQPDGCWMWRGRVNSYGYAQVSKRLYGTAMVHRFYYEHHVGPIPEGLEIDHLCRNRACVNPAHLQPVTKAENVRRGLNVRKMSYEAVERLRALRQADPKAWTYRRLALEFGLSKRYVEKVCRNERWSTRSFPRNKRP